LILSICKDRILDFDENSVLQAKCWQIVVHVVDCVLGLMRPLVVV
jgi:hypothetical protein